MPLFTCSPDDRFLERMMVTIPVFKPKGHGTYIFVKKELTAKDCDCRLCLYYKRKLKGCSLKRCPYIEERIFVGTASSKEVLTELASTVKVYAFQKRIIQHLKESEKEPMDFRNEKHRIAFTEAVRKLDKKNRVLMSAMYLLTAERRLWMTVKHHVSGNEIDFEKIRLQNSTENAYTLFCCAKDLYLGTKHITIKDLADTDLIASRIFDLICNAMAIRRFGLGAIHFGKEKDNDQSSN